MTSCEGALGSALGGYDGPQIIHARVLGERITERSGEWRTSIYE
jgi:hypothetical protein